MSEAIVFAVAGLVLVMGPGAPGAQENMGFFLTSAGPGNGADLGGLEGADAHCQALAEGDPALADLLEAASACLSLRSQSASIATGFVDPAIVSI